MRNFIQITITKKGENRARMGHPWVFEGEVLKESEKPENGSLVDVVSEKGKYIGTGFTMTIPRSGSGFFPGTPMTGSTKLFSNGGSSTPWITGKPSCPGKISKTAG